MSAKKESLAEQEEKARATAAILGLAAGIFYFGKFIPLFVIALLLGFILYSARYQLTRERQVKAYVGAALVFAFSLFVLFGAPVQYKAQRFFGIAWGSSWLNAVLDWLMREWNDLLPDFKPFRKLEVHTIHYADTARGTFGRSCPLGSPSRGFSLPGAGFGKRKWRVVGQSGF